jgi:hypothetical protein
VYEWPREEVGAPEVVAGVVVDGFGAGVLEVSAGAGAGAEEDGADDEDEDWNILRTSALLILGFSPATCFVAPVDAVTGGVVDVGVDGLDDVAAALPFVWLLLAAIEPKVLTPFVFKVGTEAGEEETGAETSSMDPKVTGEPL